MLEYLFIVSVGGIFFEPTYQSIPIIRNVPVPVVVAGTNDVFEFKAFIPDKSS